jgi:gliding motility-associated-like protein
MKKLYTFLCVFIALLGVLHPTKTMASHMMGGDVYWKYNDAGDTVFITITVYRDCSGIPFQQDAIKLLNTCTGTDIQSSANFVEGKDVTPVCKRACTTCSSGPNCTPDNTVPYGIESGTYTIAMSLAQLKKQGCCDWRVHWDQCCRNGAITTGAANENFYIEGNMNICQKYVDNSPTFLNLPLGVFCVGECVTMNPGVSDIDKNPLTGDADSLVYSWGQPLSDHDQSIPYISGYSYDEPVKFYGSDKDRTYFPGCWGIHLNSQTGDINFKAMNEDVTVMAFQIDEWRKDSTGKPIKIGTIRRDLQVRIVKCPANNSPIISGINGTSAVSINFCEGQSKCFKIQAFDQDNPDTVTMDWNHQIPGADFQILDRTKKWPTGQFCWTPPKGSARSYPYQFIVQAIDNHCPIPGRASKAFNVYVWKRPQANYSANISGCGLVTFVASQVPGSAVIQQYTWSGGGSPGYAPLFSQSSKATYKYTRPGTYTYTLTITARQDQGGCTTTYFDSVKIPNYIQVKGPNDTTICVGNPITLPVTVTKPFNPDPYHLTWSTGAADYDKASITATITKDTVFVVTVNDKNCDNYDSIKVHAKVLPKPLLVHSQRSCSGELVWLKTINSKKDVSMKSIAYKQWMKKTSSGIQMLAQGDSFPVRDSGKYAVMVMDSFGCSGSDTAMVYFNPLVKIYKQTIDGCQGDSILITAGTGGSTYIWYDLHHPNKPMPVTGPNYKAGVTNSGGLMYQVTAKRTLNGVTCTSTDTITINYHARPTVKGGKLPPQCIDGDPLNLSSFGTPKGGVWTNWNPKSKKPNPNPYGVVNNVLYPRVMDTGSHRMFYTYKDVYGCVNTDSVGIKIDTIPYPEVTAPFVCRDKGYLNLRSLEPLNMTGGTWEYYIPGAPASQQTPTLGIVHKPGRGGGMDSVFFDPTKVQDGDNILRYTYVNPTSAKCSGSDTTDVRVGTVPNATPGSYGPYCQSDGTVYFDKASRKSNVEWIPDAGVPAGSFTQSGGVGAFDVTKAPGGGTFKFYYIAYADAGKHCPHVDSTIVNVLPADTISFDTKDGKSGYCELVSDVPLVATVNGKANWTAGINYSGPGIAPGNNRFYPGLAQAGPNTITMTYHNPSGCVSTVSKVINVWKQPTIKVLSPGASCASSNDQYTFSVEVANADNIKWTGDGDFPNGNDNATVTYHPTKDELERGVLHLNVVARNTAAGTDGCAPATADLFDTIYQTPVVSVVNNDKGCAPLSVQFRNDKNLLKQNKGVMSYHWDFGDGQSSDQAEPFHVYKTAAPDGKPYTVTLTISNEHGCKNSATGLITVFANPQIAISAIPRFTTIAQPKVDFNIDKAHSTGIGSKMSYQWYFGDWNDLKDEGSAFGEQVEHKYSDTGKYTVKVIAVNQESTCTDTLVEEAYVDIRPEILAFIPNVFTPNGKYNQHTKVNEKFSVVMSSYTSFDMTIFNRWGQQVYHTNDINDGWDGNYNNQPAEEGVYVYVVKARSDSGKEYTFTGTVTLLR